MTACGMKTHGKCMKIKMMIATAPKWKKKVHATKYVCDYQCSKEKDTHSLK